jgi:hypothetical protein
MRRETGWEVGGGRREGVRGGEERDRHNGCERDKQEGGREGGKAYCASTFIWQ